MERSVALKKLQKIFGKKLRYRVDSSALSPDEREALKPEVDAAHAEHEALKKAREDRFQAILAGDAEYQRLKVESEAARKRLSKLHYDAHRRKIEVLTFEGFFNHVRASGDSWEEVIEKVSKK